MRRLAEAARWYASLTVEVLVECARDTYRWVMTRLTVPVDGQH